MDNIRALQQLYFAQQLEQEHAFDVADRLVDLFEAGLLPVDDGEGVRRLADQWRAARGTETPGGDGAPAPNRDFADLWLRFLSGVATFERPHDPSAIEKRVQAAVRLVSHPELKTRALFERSPAFRELPAEAQRQVAQDTARVADHLVRSVDFPDFVAALISGTFQAIVNSSVQQMEAYAALVRRVAQSVDEFIDDN